MGRSGASAIHDICAGLKFYKRAWMTREIFIRDQIIIGGIVYLVLGKK
jgi:hypothetical protein